MKPTRFFAVAIGLGAIVWAGCNCEPPMVRTEGDPKVVNERTDGTTSLTDFVDLNFGAVLVSDSSALSVKIKNTGRGEVNLTGVKRGEGFSDAFSTDFSPIAVPINSTVTVKFAFEPFEPGDVTSTLTITTDSTLTPGIVVNMKGRGVTGVCTIEPTGTADFGNVGVGETFNMPVVVKNGSEIDWPLQVKGITGSEADAFKVVDLASPGSVTVPAAGQVEVKIAFSPTHVGGHTAFLEMPAPRICKPSVLPLLGNGVDALLLADPKPVDFGFVNPGSSVKASVKIKNVGNTDITVTALAVSQNPAEFAVDPSTPATALLAKQGGEMTVTMTFGPTLLGPRVGELKLTTDSTSPLAATYLVPLKGFGGGPDISVSPAQLDFGVVPIGGTQTRRILVANAGTDAPGTDRDNLRLIDAAGAPCAQGPDCASGTCDLTMQRCVKSASLTSASGEFSLVWPPLGYDMAKGMAAGLSTDLVVSINPAAVGAKTATVTVYSNDPDTPAVTAQVLANAQVLPPCDYEVVPPQIVFGNVEPGRNLVLDFIVRNKSVTASQDCTLYQVEFDRTTPTAYSFVGTPPKNKAIPAGGAERIQVKFAPTATVKLSGSAQSGCLMVAPTDLDFGVVQTGCGSRERTFTVYNVCTTPVTVTTIAVQAGTSNEFKVTSMPALPATIAAGDKLEFKVKYSPTDVGKDTASIGVLTTAIAQPYVVTLQGRGDTVAIQTDVFTQDAQPKVDMLIVEDDSCSMEDKQQSLATNFDSLIKFAVAQAIDYHIAVTTTDVGFTSSSPNCDSGTICGRFVPVPGITTGRGVPDSNPRVIGQNTANKETIFKQNVAEGTTGSGTERHMDALYKSLSAPNVTGWNSGFLRDEATLAVVVVSDAEDQSYSPVNFYYNFLMNVKGFRRANMISYSGVVPLTANSGVGTCYYDTPSQGRHLSMVQRTGGVSEDICTPDWNKALQKLSQNAFGYRTRFFLTSQPDPNFTIEVKVDGVTYDAIGPRGDVRWTYNSTQNAIDFDPLAVPEPGSVLSISYRVQCLPP